MTSADAGRLGVTIVIPTYNAARDLPRCLASIRDQDFPRSRIEVLVMDGYSTDATRDIAARFDCRVVDNPQRLAEPGVKLGLSLASNPIRVVMAADNDFPRRDWLDRVVRVFESSDVRAVYTHVVSAPDDDAFCRYFNLLHADPFNWFIHGRTVHPAGYARTRAVLTATDNHVVYDLAAGDRPLLALAQGTAVQGDLPMDVDNDQDDVLPLWQMLDDGAHLAYCDVGIHHHTVMGFRDFLRKYDRRARNALSASDAAHRQRHQLLSPRQRLRRYLWIPYSLSFVLPLLDAVRGLVRDRDPAWLYHPFACWGLSAVMAHAVVTSRKGGS